jgi:hypothetical protein
VPDISRIGRLAPALDIAMTTGRRPRMRKVIAKKLRM